MEREIDYKALYQLQDRVMDEVFALDNNFYLTGVTALHRFYYHLRYSDDLDFFTYSDTLFRESIIENIEITPPCKWLKYVMIFYMRVQNYREV